MTNDTRDDDARKTDIAPSHDAEQAPEIPPAPRMPREAASTQPPPRMTQAELDAEAEAIRGSLTPAGILPTAANKLIEMYQYSRQRDFNLLDPEGSLARQQRALLGNFKTEVVQELAAVVESITTAAMGALGAKIEGLARGQQKHGQSIDELRSEFAEMRLRVDELERKIKEFDAARDAQASTAVKS
jgi:hypothetical protein